MKDPVVKEIAAKNQKTAAQVLLRWAVQQDIGNMNREKMEYFIMTSANGNIFRVTGPLWGESTGHRWIPHTKSSDAELWCFLWCAPEQTLEQTSETPVIWDAIVLIMASP